MNPKGLVTLLFEIPRTQIGRIIVGIFFAAGVTYIGISGLIDGEVWIPSSKPWTSGAMKFGRNAGMSASFFYLFLGIMIHYIGFWRRGRIEDTNNDPVAFVLAFTCALFILGFIVLSIIGI